MKFSLVALALCASATVAKEIPNPERDMRVFSGEKHMEIMGIKRNSFQEKREAGVYTQDYPKITRKTPCRNGKAGEFRCKNVDLYSFYSHKHLGSQTGEGSSSWGWTKYGMEFIIIAQVRSAETPPFYHLSSEQ